MLDGGTGLPGFGRGTHFIQVFEQVLSNTLKVLLSIRIVELRKSFAGFKNSRTGDILQIGKVSKTS